MSPSPLIFMWCKTRWFGPATQPRFSIEAPALFPSNHDLAATRHDGLAGHELVASGGEERDNLRDLIWRSGVSDGNALDRAWKPPLFLSPLRRYRTGADAIDQDSFAGQLEGQCLHQAADGRLGGGVTRIDGLVNSR